MAGKSNGGDEWLLILSLLGNLVQASGTQQKQHQLEQATDLNRALLENREEILGKLEEYGRSLAQLQEEIGRLKALNGDLLRELDTKETRVQELVRENDSLKAQRLEQPEIFDSRNPPTHRQTMTSDALNVREVTIEREVGHILDFPGGQRLLLPANRLPVRRKPEFKALSIDTRCFKFDREAANLR